LVSLNDSNASFGKVTWLLLHLVLDMLDMNLVLLTNQISLVFLFLRILLEFTVNSLVIMHLNGLIFLSFLYSQFFLFILEQFRFSFLDKLFSLNSISVSIKSGITFVQFSSDVFSLLLEEILFVLGQLGRVVVVNTLISFIQFVEFVFFFLENVGEQVVSLPADGGWNSFECLFVVIFYILILPLNIEQFSFLLLSFISCVDFVLFHLLNFI